VVICIRNYLGVNPMRMIPALIVAALAAPAAEAAVFVPLAAPQITAAGVAEAETLILGLLTADAVDGVSTAPAAATGLTLSLSGDLVGGALTSATLFVTDPDTFLRADTLLLTRLTDFDGVDGFDLIALEMGDISGLAAGAFGSRILVEIAGKFGMDPFVDGFAVPDATITVSPLAAIPLPAALWLSLAGLGALVAAGRRAA